MRRSCAALSGSSPLARGLRLIRDNYPYARRIIPARAGFTSPMNKSVQTAQDHPRSRGVYRGRMSRISILRWIIPARAGFTRPRGRSERRSKDHPRSRGVYRRWKREHFLRRGSSPLARGLRPPITIRPACRRIIPARAGFTGCRVGGGECCADHPRSRGVYGR